MIDGDKIKIGAAAVLLVTSLAIGGIAFTNGDVITKESSKEVFSVENVIAKNEEAKSDDKKTQEEIDEALLYTASEDAPLWVEPEIIPYGDDVEAAAVPYGYGIYQFKNDVSGVLGIEVKDDSIWYIGCNGKSMQGSFGVKKEYLKVLRLMDTLPSAIKNGTADKTLYVELEKSVAENGMNELRVPQGYGLFYVGSEEEKRAGMIGIGYEKDGQKVTLELGEEEDFSKWDTEVATIPADCSTDYVGVPMKLKQAFLQAEGIKREMESYYNGLQSKTIS